VTFHELESDGPVQLRCNDVSAAQARWSYARMTAVQANTLVNKWRDAVG